MPRGGARVGAGRPKGSGRKSAGPKTVRPASVASPATVEEAPPADALEPLPDVEIAITQNPLDYMLRVINDPKADAARRDRMAVAAAPYVHGRVEQGGKRSQTQAKAEGKAKPGAKFAPRAAPVLVSSR